MAVVTGLYGAGSAGAGLLGVAGAGLGGVVVAAVGMHFAKGTWEEKYSKELLGLVVLALALMSCMKASRVCYAKLARRVSKLPPLHKYVTMTNRVGLAAAAAGVGGATIKRVVMEASPNLHP